MDAEGAGALSLFFIWESTKFPTKHLKQYGHCYFAHKDKDIMIDKAEVIKTIEAAIAESDLFLVDVTVSRDNNIVVEIDSMDSVSIDDCAKINKAIEAVFDRDVEDYELEVGSAGLTSPFKVRQQYEKYEGEEVEVLSKDGRKLKGTLKESGEEGFTLTITKKVKPEGAKRPVEVEEDLKFNYSEIKYTKYLIQFK